MNRLDPRGDKHWGPLGPYAPFLVELHTPEQSPVRVLRTRQPPGSYPDPALPELAINRNLGARSEASIDFGLGARDMQLRCGEMVLAPPHVDCHYEVRRPFELLIVCLSSPWVDQALHGEGAPARPTDFGALHEESCADPTALALTDVLWRECARAGGAERLLVDSLAMALSAALFKSAKAANGARRDSDTGEPPRGRAAASARLRRALDFVEASLDADLSVDAIADVAAVSPRHLARLFREDFNQTPDGYVTARRLERAQALLATTDLAIAEVGLRCGFSGQSLFGERFRESFGVTPGQYRRQRQG